MVPQLTPARTPQRQGPAHRSPTSRRRRAQPDDAGLRLGLPAGWLISRGFASQFFQVRPTDASIYLIVAVTVGVIAIVAAFVPARRAANVDPVVSLRAS
jgi:hypothetical protein